MGTMAVLIVIELLTLWFAIQTLSSVRAVVGAEGLWSKAQKDAIYQLEKYCRTRNVADYNAFMRFMQVPLGDHKTRMELMKKDVNMDIARQGFLEGRNHPDDIDGMIMLMRRFHNISYINRAINIWAQGDSIIAQLLPIGDSLYNAINSGTANDSVLHALVEKIDPINHRLTVLEDNFSYTLGEGSRWLENLILKLLFIVALTVEITGLILSISLSRNISKGLNEINRAAKNVARGNFDTRAKVFSKDEIGQVAISINRMTQQLINSNKELAQFAYIASHDLQEPLRTISTYSDLLQTKHKEKLDAQTAKHLDVISRAASRMNNLIKGLLDYSRIGHSNEIIAIDCNKMLSDVLHDMEAAINESGAIVKSGNLPVIKGYADLQVVFQNLISNAVKFRKADTRPLIYIDAVKRNGEWLFSVTDNGIGIEKIYFEKIFTIFQKLHSQKEFAGTGIGLAHCKKVIEIHGGKIWVESASGAGCTFYFTIPVK